MKWANGWLKDPSDPSLDTILAAVTGREEIVRFQVPAISRMLAAVYTMTPAILLGVQEWEGYVDHKFIQFNADWDDFESQLEAAGWRREVGPGVNSLGGKPAWIYWYPPEEAK
jgi:hypothetical protein